MKKFFIFMLFSILLLFSCKHRDSGEQNQVKPELPARPQNTCKVSILNQVNGDYVKGLKLSIYESGKHNKVFEEVAFFGVVYPKLEAGKVYDIAVTGDERRASSFVKNLKIKSDKDDVSVVVLTKSQNTRKEAFIDLKEFRWENGSEKKDIEDGITINSPIRGRFVAKVTSSSSAIYKSITYGFAARLGLGILPTTTGSVLKKSFVDGSIEQYPNEEDSEWTSEVKFDCTAGVWESFTDESQDLIAVFYDATGNRLETHNYIIVKPSVASFTKYTGDQYTLKDFHIETKTYKSYNQTYSVGVKDEQAFSQSEKVHYAPTIFFSLNDKNSSPVNHPQVLGIEVFRREATQNKEFEKLFNVTYKNKENIREDNTYIGSYVLDTTGTAEVGKEYEYKIKIYLPSGYFIESDIAKCKILPQCKVYLHSPANNSQFTIPSAYATFDKVLKDFTVQLSSPKLMSAKEADYFTIGVNIRTFRNEEIYKMLLRYHFDYMGQGKPEIELATLQNKVLSKATVTELKQKKLLPYYIQVEDLVKFDEATGMVTLTEQLLSSRLINVSEKWDTFKMSEVYYWDVFGSGADFLGAVTPKSRTHVPPSFTKEYKSENGTMSYSTSFCAGLLLSSTTSENGRFAFTIKGTEDSSATTGLARSRENAIQGSYLVKANSKFKISDLTRLNAQVYGKIDMEDGFSWYCIRTSQKEDIIFSLQKLEGVICADYEHEMKIPTVTEQTSPTLKTFDFNDKVFAGSGYSLTITKALDAYEEVGFGENKVLCGIVDSGVAPSHEDLKDEQGKSIIKEYLVQNIVKVGDQLALQGWRKFENTEPKADPVGHGSHCVGIMAACGNNNKGITGVSWKNTEVVVFRGLGDPNTSYFGEFASLDGIRQFTNYVKYSRDKGDLEQECVPLNLSFGTPTPSPLAIEVINYALENGVLPVVAMANDGLTLPSYPAAYSGVLAVGSSNGSDKISAYSNKGPWISVVAPGENIMSLDGGIMSKDPSNNKSYVCFNGTSMAAPFVTGAVAYLAGLNPELTPMQMKHIIEQTADKIEGAESFTSERGYGRINLLKAARMAKKGNLEKCPYSSFALKAEIKPKLREEDGGSSFDFHNYVPYVFLYDSNEVCIAGGYLVAPDGMIKDKPDTMNTVSFRGLKRGRYTLKVASYVYTDWPKVYRLIDEKTVYFRGDQDETVEFGEYSIIIK